jgi:hypothetical protein
MLENKEYQRIWYNRQRGIPKIYLLTDGENFYIGSTTNSLHKRLWQHKAITSRTRELFNWDRAEISLLEEVVNRNTTKEIEQKWISTLQPNLNKHAAFKKKSPLEPRIYKGGITHDGEFFPTLKALWEAKGKVPYNTFKTRIHRGMTLSKALGNYF